VGAERELELVAAHAQVGEKGRGSRPGGVGMGKWDVRHRGMEHAGMMGRGGA
jgi:hypothetical protein